MTWWRFVLFILVCTLPMVGTAAFVDSRMPNGWPSALVKGLFFGLYLALWTTLARRLFPERATEPSE